MTFAWSCPSILSLHWLQDAEAQRSVADVVSEVMNVRRAGRPLNLFLVGYAITYFWTIGRAGRTKRRGDKETFLNDFNSGRCQKIGVAGGLKACSWYVGVPQLLRGLLNISQTFLWFSKPTSIHAALHAGPYRKLTRFCLEWTYHTCRAHNNRSINCLTLSGPGKVLTYGLFWCIPYWYAKQLFYGANPSTCLMHLRRLFWSEKAAQTMSRCPGFPSVHSYSDKRFFGYWVA